MSQKEGLLKKNLYKYIPSKKYTKSSSPTEGGLRNQTSSDSKTEAQRFFKEKSK